MTKVRPLRESAEALLREAVRLDQGADAEAEAKRITAKVDLLSAALGELENSAAAVRALRGIMGNDPGIDLSVAADGLPAFTRHARAGRPSDQAFTAARNKIVGASSALRKGLSDAWTHFAARRIEELPVRRLDLLPRAQQKEQRQRLATLRALANKIPPSSADLHEFDVAFGAISEALAELSDPAPELAAVLHKLDTSPPATLGDLSDEDVARLRQAGIAEQIELIRRKM